MKCSFWFQSGLILVGECGVILVAMILNPDSASKFWGILPQRFHQSTPSLSYYWDIQAYAELAIHQTCSAFYPLWPSLIRWIFHPETVYAAGRAFLVSATILNCMSVPLSLWVFRQVFANPDLAFSIAILYHFSPFSIFRFIGYTESLFCCLSFCLIGLLWRSSRPDRIFSGWIALVLLFLTIVLLSITRPTLIQLIGASLGTGVSLGIIYYFNHKNDIKTKNSNFFDRVINSLNSASFLENPYAYLLIITLIIGISAVVGYSLYGAFCWFTTEDFFGPFSQQKLWNKSLGFRPWLFFTSRSPLVDLLGLYFPFLLWVITWGQIGQAWGYFAVAPLRGGKWAWLLTLYPPLWIALQTLGKTFLPSPPRSILTLPFWATAYEFWFALYFAAAHSAIAFLTQDRLVSLGRYIFGQPFIFLVLGFLYPHLQRSHQKVVFPACLALSIGWLLDQWIRYGDDRWLG